ncbi:MAG: glycosyltransferase [Nitrospira sp.]|nr:glycosyltransferase [Nitrospira sp.]
MKRVLIVAYYFPPVAASGAMRPLGFCRNLPDYGWQPQVLTTTPECVYPAHQVDMKLGERVPGTIDVMRVPYKDRLQQVLQYRERLRGLLRKTVDTDWEKRQDKTRGVTSAGQSGALRASVKDLLLDWVFAFPDRQWGWYAPAVRHLQQIDEKETPDVVFATGGPWTNFLVGCALAKRLKRPLVLDYRDPWNCNPYYSFSSPMLTRKSQMAEAQACRAASRIIANTEELRDRLVKEYSDLRERCTWIPNGFDREVLAAKDAFDRKAADNQISGGYELCHFGTVYGKRTPRVLFQAVWELFRDGHLKPDAIRLRFVGGWDSTDQECERYALDLEQHGFLRREPPVSHSRCLKEMNRSPVLLVLQPDSPLQVPGKIYEYVATGRPLLLIGGEGATANLVNRHALGVSCPNQIANIKALLNELSTGTRKLVPPDATRVNRFEYRSLTGELATVLDAAMRGGEGPILVPS